MWVRPGQVLSLVPDRQVVATLQVTITASLFPFVSFSAFSVVGKDLCIYFYIDIVGVDGDTQNN